MPDRTYTTPEDECDVLDKNNLAKFRAKRLEWLAWLSDEPVNSIWAQISGMLWNYAAFRTANEARRIAQMSGKPSAAQNGLVGQLLDDGFVATQALAIRRLQEPASKDDAKQIISLKRLLQDVAAHRAIVTREAYVCFDGAPYDPTVKRTYDTGVGWRALDKYDLSSDAHRTFDVLSGKNAANRDRTDLIAPAYMGNLFRRFEDPAVREVSDFATKFIAHSADEASRATSSIGGLSFAKLDACHKAVYEVAFKITAYIVNDGDHGAFPMSQGDIAFNLEHPWASEEDLQALRDFWDAHDEKYDAWRQSFFQL